MCSADGQWHPHHVFIYATCEWGKSLQVVIILEMGEQLSVSMERHVSIIYSNENVYMKWQLNLFETLNFIFAIGMFFGGKK